MLYVGIEVYGSHMTINHKQKKMIMDTKDWNNNMF